MNAFHGLTIPKSLEELVSPQNTALVVYDMQAGIVRQIANGREITNRVAQVLRAARSAGVRTGAGGRELGQAYLDGADQDVGRVPGAGDGDGPG